VTWGVPQGGVRRGRSVKEDLQNAEREGTRAVTEAAMQGGAEGGRFRQEDP